MNNSARRKLAASASDPIKVLVRLLQDFTPRHRLAVVFTDFVEMSAIAVSNGLDTAYFDVREKRYLELAGKYDRDEMSRFAEGLALLALALSAGPDDVLGKVYMALDLGSARAGQFFTPFEVSCLIANMLLVDVQAEVAAKGFLTFHEPACGAGGMILACVQSLLNAQVQPQAVMHATCVDIDRTCVHMTFLQLAMLNVPAVVLHGNSLSLEIWDAWRTPAHLMGDWAARLAAREAAQPESPGPAEAAVSERDVSSRATAAPDQPASPADADGAAARPGSGDIFSKAVQLGLF